MQFFDELGRRSYLRLVNGLEEARAMFGHGGVRGGHAEIVHRQFLGTVWPKRYQAKHGELIDAVGGRSRQVDVIVIDEDHPDFLGFAADAPGLYVSEGVHVAAEVKIDMSSNDQLSKALQVASSVSSLNRQPGDGDESFGQLESLQIFTNRPPFYLFAYEGLTLSSLEKRQGDLDAAGVDAVFFLDRGSAINLGAGSRNFRLSRRDNGERLSGWHYFGGSPVDTATLFLKWLTVEPPALRRKSPLMARYVDAQLSARRQP